MHQHTVLDSLKDADISVRKKALGLLFVLADATNAQEIVSELVLNLSSAEAAIKEDMVVKIAILAEKHSGESHPSPPSIFLILVFIYIQAVRAVFAGTWTPWCRSCLWPETTWPRSCGSASCRW
jgi:hypothetical protein